MKLNEDAQHVPLSNKGHLSAMTQWGAMQECMCRHLHQLEAHKLLQYGDQVVYPEGLNEGLGAGPNLTISGHSPGGMDTLGKPACEPLLLQMDLSSARLKDQVSIALGLCRDSTSSSLLTFSYGVCQCSS